MAPLPQNAVNKERKSTRNIKRKLLNDTAKISYDEEASFSNQTAKTQRVDKGSNVLDIVSMISANFDQLRPNITKSVPPPPPPPRSADMSQRLSRFDVLPKRASQFLMQMEEEKLAMNEYVIRLIDEKEEMKAQTLRILPTVDELKNFMKTCDAEKIRIIQQRLQDLTVASYRALAIKNHVNDDGTWSETSLETKSIKQDPSVYNWKRVVSGAGVEYFCKKDMSESQWAPPMSSQGQYDISGRAG